MVVLAFEQNYLTPTHHQLLLTFALRFLYSAHTFFVAMVRPSMYHRNKRAAGRARPLPKQPILRYRHLPFLVNELPGSSKDVQYEVTKELGRGSGGVVYQAEVTTVRCRGRQVALKAQFNRASVRIAFDRCAQ